MSNNDFTKYVRLKEFKEHLKHERHIVKKNYYETLARWKTMSLISDWRDTRRCFLFSYDLD